MTMNEYLDKTNVTVETIQREVLDFISDRNDIVVVGAWGVNMHTSLDDQRHTNDIDVVTVNPQAVANLIKSHLQQRLGIAARIRECKHVFRVYRKLNGQTQHLVDILGEETLPDHCSIGGVMVATVASLIKMKELSEKQRSDPRKKLLDQADLISLRKAAEKERTNARDRDY